LDPKLVKRLIETALEEDCASEDVTTAALIGPETFFRGKITARESLVVAGLELARVAMTLRGPHVKFTSLVEDGARVDAGDAICKVEGPAREVLPAERAALNFLGRLCGIATLTASYIKAMEGTAATLVDTRKTTPGLRIVEKYAVRMGGGENHRLDLASMAMIKDNHIAASGLSPLDAAKLVREKVGPDVIIDLEVDNLPSARAALAAPVDILMLDNFTPQQVAELVAERDRTCASGKPLIEVSGGVLLDNIRAYALTGADRIAVGAIIHGARFMDLGLDGELS